MRMRFILVALSLFAVSAVAQDGDSDFTDHMALTKVMRAHGIEPAYVQWAPINALCIDLDSETDHVAYNRCKFDKAMDVTLFTSDRGECIQEARAANPDSLLKDQQQISSTTGLATATTTIQPALSVEDLKAKRAASLNSCMRGRGWRDATNAFHGRGDKL